MITPGSQGVKIIFPFYLQFFMKATSLEQISSDYLFVMEKKNIALDTLQRKEQVLTVWCECLSLCHLRQDCHNRKNEGLLTLE